METPLDKALLRYYNQRVFSNRYSLHRRLFVLCAMLAVLAVWHGALPRPAYSQATLLCKDCGSADNNVLVLDAHIPEPELATLAWKSATDERPNFLTFLLRPGRHAYDFSENAEWQGDISVLVNPEGFPARFAALRPPSVMDSLDTFLAPELVSWGQPNVLRRNAKLFGFDYDLLLIALCPVAVGIAFFLFRKTLRTSLLVGLVLVFVLMDLRADYGHMQTMDSLENHFFFTPWQKNAEILEKMASAMPSVPWCEKQMDWPLRTLANYKLLGKPLGQGEQCKQWVVVTPETFAVENTP